MIHVICLYLLVIIFTKQVSKIQVSKYTKSTKLQLLIIIDDKRWRVVFENVYGQTSERENLKKLDFYQILGNHDHRGNQTAQIIYDDLNPESNWNFPWYWHTIQINKNDNLSMKLIMIDTMIMMNAGEVD